MSVPLSKMDRVSIKIKLEGGKHFELSSPTYEQVSNAVFSLSRQNQSVKIPELPLKFEILAFGRSHMLVETPVEENGKRDVVVYGVECSKDARMSPEQVAKRVDEVFGVNVHDTITAMRTPEGVYAEGSDGSIYPCGTLFTSGSYSTSSSYSPIAIPPTHTHPHTPTPSQRPGHLPIHVIESQLTTPKPVATPNRNCRKDALVAGTASYNVPADNVNEDSVVVTDIQCRKAPVEVPVAIHQGLEPVQKAKVEHAGGTTLMGVINLETPSQNMPYSDQNIPAGYPFLKQKVQLKVEDGEPRSPDQVAVEISSEESEERLTNPSKCGLVAENNDNKALNNQLVVGIGSGLAPPAFGRQLSLPGQKTETQQSPHRNSSEDNLAAKHARSSSDVGLNLEVSPCEPAGVPKDTPLSPPHTPATPTKPLAIQREDSVAAPEQIEFVMPKAVKPVSVVLCDKNEVKDTHMPVLSEPPVFKVPGEGTQEPSKEQSSDKHEEEEAGAFKVLEVKQARTPTDEGSDSDQPALSDLMQQVHLLEHALNEYCFLKDDCKTFTRENTEFKQAVEQMKAMVEEARNGTQDQDLKDYILVHCRNCRDKSCKIPHIWAGCPPAGEIISGSDTGTETTDSPQYQPLESDSPCQPAPYEQQVSFDEESNHSTDSEYQRYLEQMHQSSDVIQRLHPTKFGPTPPDSPKDKIDNGPVQPDDQDQTASFFPLFNRREMHGSPPQVVPNGAVYFVPPAVHTTDQQRSGALSPMYTSAGFNLHVPGARPGRGQQCQESQLGAETYNNHQVSDKGQSDRRPRERGQYSFLDPSRSRSALKKMYEKNEDLFMAVKDGLFPSYHFFHRQARGTLIYSNSSENGLVPGVVHPCPNPHRDQLGKGGNGTVFKFPLGGKQYALKKTTYREGELNTWSLLQHRNIVPLLGVMLGDTVREPPPRSREYLECYQVMPCMSGDLRSMLVDKGDLLTHLKDHPEKWGVFSSNFLYVLTEVATGLQYLHSENIQHSDLKAQNILIMKKATCSCDDLLHCDCTGEDKYDVKIADFDSLKKTKFPRQLAEVCLEPMNNCDMNFVKGTPAYRGPEQFKDCRNQAKFKRTLHDGSVYHDMEGPWCDMWSLGVIVLQMVLGSHNRGPYINEACILTNCKTDKMTARIEPTVARIRLSELQYLSAEKHPELKLFATVARECLKIDCTKRATADAVLQLLQGASKS